MKKYALLILESLEVKRFDFLDEFKSAMDTLDEASKSYICLRYNASFGGYVQSEAYRF